MKTKSIISFLKTAVSLAILTASVQTQAQSYPTKPINLIVPYSAGGSIDIIGRLLGQKLAQDLKVSVIVENKTGFAGNIGAQIVARSAPDGYTLLMASLTTYSMNNKLSGPKQMGYDLLNDFRALAVVGKMPEVLVVNKDVPANNLAELITHLKKNPGRDAFGSSGLGSIGHVSGELFKLRAGVNILHVPYRGTPPALLDVMSGHIQMMFSTTPALLGDLANGKLKAIAVAADERDATLPNVPTLTEQGLANLDLTSYPGVLVPVNTPDAIVTKLNASLQKILKDPDVRKQLSQQGIHALVNDTKQANQLFANEVSKWDKLIEEAHIVLAK